MITHIIVAQSMVFCQDKAVEISSFCQLAETLNMQLLPTNPTITNPRGIDLPIHLKFFLTYSDTFELPQ